MQEVGGVEVLKGRSRELDVLQLDFKDGVALRRALHGIDAVLHTAGPYLGEQPDVLRVCYQ